MPATVVVGTQWGDEGKGKLTDLLAKEMHVVVCRQGINPMVTSRGPGDLVPFCRHLVDVFATQGVLV